MKNSSEEEITVNLKKCPYWENCSRNLCPLDFEIHLRVGNESDKCRWMKEPQKKKIKGQAFTSGGSAMPNGILIFVPRTNLKWLNKASLNGLQRLKNYGQEK